MKKPKSKWEVLRKTLEQELKLTKSAIEFDNEITEQTVNWVLQEMDAIEKTGKAF